MTHTITIAGKPCARKAHKIARVAGFSKPVLQQEDVSFQNLVKLCAKRDMNGHKPLSGCIHADYTFIFPAPLTSLRKAEKQKIANGELIPCFTNRKFDLDNLIKNTNDGLTGIAVQDDGMIQKLTASKFYGDEPMTKIHLWIAEENQ